MERFHHVMKAGVVLLVLAGMQRRSGRITALCPSRCSPRTRGGRWKSWFPSVRKAVVLSRRRRQQRTSNSATLAYPRLRSVGNGSCNQLVVRDVPIKWKENHLLTVTYDPEPCMPERPPALVPVCEVLFRVSHTKGDWIEKASIQFQASGVAPLEADSAGRALRVLKAGDRITGTVVSRGYASKPFSVSCSRSEPVLEESIKLERQ